MYKPTGGRLKPITEFKTFSGVEYQKRKESFNTIGGSWGGLQKIKPVFQRNDLFCIVTAYLHDSLLNLVTALANETYFFRYRCIRSMEPAEEPGNSVFTGTGKRTAGNRPPIESGQHR